MPILHIEHPITDLGTWLEAFGRFAPAREQAGVTDTKVFQPVDDPNYIMVNLRFESADAAANFRKFLQDVVWSSPEASPGLAGSPTSRVLTEVSLPGG
jgi:heme-degrading monooxygenase HmoA